MYINPIVIYNSGGYTSKSEDSLNLMREIVGDDIFTIMTCDCNSCIEYAYNSIRDRE